MKNLNMIRALHHNRATLGFAVLMLLLSANDRLEAQTTPFKITGAGVGPDGLPLPGVDPRSVGPCLPYPSPSSSPQGDPI